MPRKNAIFMKVLSIDLLLLCCSFNFAVIGQMFEPLKKAYALTIAQTSLLPSIQGIGGFAAVLACILFMDSFNKQKVMVTAAFVYFAMFMAIGIRSPLLILFGIFILIGIAGGTTETLTNAVMVDTVERKSEKYINFMHTMFALGAVIAPLLSQYIYTYYGFMGVFLTMGTFAIMCAFFSGAAYRKEFKLPYIKTGVGFTERFKEMIRVYKKPGMVEIGLMTMLFNSWQCTAMLYTSSMISGLRNNPADGALALSIFFLGIMLSRLIFTKFATWFSQGRVLALGNFLGILGWVAALLAPGLVLKIVFIGVTAFFCGNNFPVTISAACKIAPKNTAAASGTVILGSYIASFFAPPAIGALADSIGLNNALIFTAIPLLLLIPVALNLHKKMQTAVWHNSTELGLKCTPCCRQFEMV